MGTCLDGAVVEDFLVLSKIELIYLQKLRFMELFRQEFVAYLVYVITPSNLKWAFVKAGYIPFCLDLNWTNAPGFLHVLLKFIENSDR